MSVKFKKTNATKQKIIDGYLALYSANPGGKITVKEIAEKAGVSRVTFYQYFSDVDDVRHKLEEYIYRLTQEVYDNIRVSGPEISVNQLASTNSSLAEIRAKYWPIIKDLEKSPEYRSKVRGGFKDLLCEVFPDTFNRNDVASSFMLEFYTSGIMGSIDWWQENGNTSSWETAVGELLSTNLIASNHK